ncbi:MAG TPA: hypothetical protein VL068_07330, partial [Microthrixaceae bacterium]|nr:hypothetical protein [Microthrixaceae bacterium]
MTMQADQRERLLVSKLTGLVRTSGLSEDQPLDPEVRGSLTVAIAGKTAYGLIERGEPGAVASAVLWAARNSCPALTLFVDEGGPGAARFSRYFAPTGAGSDLSIVVREVRGASSVVVEPDSVPVPMAAPEDAAELMDVMRSHGLEVVVEHGIVRGEVLGLEVARLVRWPASNGGDDELHLEAGVGRFDRDAVAAVNPDMAPETALLRTLEMVRKHRYPGAPVHPLQMLSQERWLRVSVLANPKLVGATRLEAVAMTSEALGMRDAHPA